MSVDGILREINALSPDDYARLMDSLAVLLHKTDPQIDQIWAEEIDRRIQEIDSGESELIDWEVIRGQIRRPRPSE